MERQTATSILQALAHGIDPRTGEAWPADSPYQHPDTVRALFCALQALEGGDAPPSRPARTPPGNAGKPWSEEEDHRLAAGFDAGIRIPELAGQHDRSRAAIEARLLKLGKLAVPSGRAPRFRVASPEAVYAITA